MFSGALFSMRGTSQGPTAILSSGRVSCSSSSSGILEPLHACLCKADELSIRKGMSGKYITVLCTAFVSQSRMLSVLSVVFTGGWEF